MQCRWQPGGEQGLVRDWHLEQLCRLRYFKEEGARLRRLERNAARSGKAFPVPTHRASTNIAGVCGGGNDGHPAALDLTANGDLAIPCSQTHTVHPHVSKHSQEMLPVAGKRAIAEVSMTSHPGAGESLHAVCTMHAGGPRRDVLDRQSDAKLIDGPSDFATLRLSGMDGSNSTGSLSVSDLQALPAHRRFALYKEQLSTARTMPTSGDSLGVALDLDRDRQDLAERVTALTLSLSTAESDAAGLQRDLEQSSKDLERCKAELETCRLERISLLNSTGEQVSKLETQNHDLADTVDGLSRRLSACQAQLDTELEDGIVKATQIQTIKTQLATVQDEVRELRRDKQTLEDRLSAVRSQEDTTVTKLTQDLESAMSIAEEVCKAGANLWHAQLAANETNGILKDELEDVAWKHRVEMEQKEKEGRHRDLAIAALQEEVGVLKGKVVEAEQAQAEADETAERRRKEAIAVCAREEGLREELSQARGREGALIERQSEREAEVKILLTEEARRQETLSKMQGECNDQLQRQLQTNADLSVQVQEGRRELQAMRQKTVDTILGMKEMLRQGATANAMRVCKCEHLLADVLREFESHFAAAEQRRLDCFKDEGIMVGKAQGSAQPGYDSSCIQAARRLLQQARRPDPSTPVPSPGIRAGGGVCVFSPRARADTEQLRRRFEAAINEANHSRNYSLGDG